MTYQDNYPTTLDRAHAVIRSVIGVLNEQTNRDHSEDCKAPVWECVENAFLALRKELDNAITMSEVTGSKALRLATENRQLRSLVHTLTAEERS